MNLYRLPWCAADNAMTWLEPTRHCNITCDACFVENDRRSEKNLAQIRHELEVMLSLRRCDALLIAGGEPLTHPAITDIVALVKSLGVKPVIVTNGVKLDEHLLKELKRAGAYGFTLHVDSHQARPGWRGKDERALNELRTHFADMIYRERGLTCAFNTTIFPDTLAQVPAIVEWAVAHADRVHVLTLICVRMAHPDDPWDYFVGNEPVDFAATAYMSTERYGHLMTPDITERIKQVLPNYQFAAFLGGTVLADSLKWAIGTHLTRDGASFGCLGARSFELLQAGSHFFRRRYLAFAPPRASRSGRSALLLGVLDPAVRHAAAGYLRAVLTRPTLLFKRLHLQSISVVQPADILDNDQWDTCDGCPNATYWNDRLVPACRADEYRRWGAPVHVVRRKEVRA